MKKALLIIHTDKKLYVTFSGFLAAGWKDDTVKKANLRNGANWQMETNPYTGKPMVAYETLTDEHKQKLKAYFGDVYDYVAKDPLRKLVERDFQALEFYSTYRYEKNGKQETLPSEHVEKYTLAASWLNMISKLLADKVYIKKTLNLKLDSFWLSVCDIIKTDGIELPFNHGNLRKRVELYKEKGYASLIDWRFGNANSAKIVEGECKEVLKGFIEHPNQYDDVLIAALYNQWASQNGYKDIKPGIVGVRRKEWEVELTPSRNGWDAFNRKFIRQVKGLPANTMHPLALVECDDYNINYYYNDNEAEKSKSLQRYASYIVADSSCGLILGASYRQAQAPTFDMVQIAWIDAMYYIRSLANDGNWYMPYEVKADHWNKNTAHPYFKNIGHFIAPQVANKSGRGYIEQLFGSPHFKRAEKMAAHNELNYNGNNITARNRGVNVEVLKHTKGRLRVGAEAESQIDKFLWYTRKMPSITKDNLNAPSREQLWVERWNAMPTEQKRPISDLQFLSIFGIKHEHNGRAIAITNRGIEPVIGGVQYSYDLPNHTEMMHLIGTKVHVVYDPYDMSRVLITDFDRIRFIAKHAVLQPRALAYQYDGSRQALNMILADKKAQVNKVAKLAEGRNYMDMEAIMLAGMMPKEELAMVEQTYIEQTANSYPTQDEWLTRKQERIRSKIDFNEY